MTPDPPAVGDTVQRKRGNRGIWTVTEVTEHFVHMENGHTVQVMPKSRIWWYFRPVEVEETT